MSVLLLFIIACVVAGDETFQKEGADPNSIEFWLLSPDIAPPHQIIHNDSTSLGKFNPGISTIFVVDGFLSNATTEMSRDISQSLVAKYKSTSNIILVDWGTFSGNKDWDSTPDAGKLNLYLKVAQKNVPVVAKRLCQFSRFLHFISVDAPLVEVVSHSLGSHIAGQAGRLCKALGSPFARIAALDPAGPFFNQNHDKQVSRFDAEAVEIYHTDADCDSEFGYGVCGDVKGTVNIYVNGGNRPQPRESQKMFGPVLDTYAHAYSYRVYNHSIFGVPLLGCPCSDANNCACKTSCSMCKSFVNLGRDIDPRLAGNFWAETALMFSRSSNFWLPQQNI